MIDSLILLGGIVILVGGVAVLADWRALGTRQVPRRGRNLLGVGGEVVDPRDPWAIRWRVATACTYFIVGAGWITISTMRIV
jgi:hypothetical protein